MQLVAAAQCSLNSFVRVTLYPPTYSCFMALNRQTELTHRKTRAGKDEGHPFFSFFSSNTFMHFSPIRWPLGYAACLWLKEGGHSCCSCCTCVQAGWMERQTLMQLRNSPMYKVCVYVCVCVCVCVRVCVCVCVFSFLTV